MAFFDVSDFNPRRAGSALPPPSSVGAWNVNSMVLVSSGLDGSIVLGMEIGMLDTSVHDCVPFPTPLIDIACGILVL
jgi:hypothetical protein